MKGSMLAVGGNVMILWFHPVNRMIRMYQMGESWLVLAHQMPGKPAYHRVKLWRRLHDSGAVALKNAVYVLPAGEAARALFAAIARDIEKAGGSSAVYQAELVAGMRDEDLKALFRAARDADYAALAAELRALARKKPKAPGAPALGRIAQRLAQVAKIDFFAAAGRAPVQALLARLEHSGITREAPAAKPGRADLSNKVWVTRRDIHVDRIACAWLIKRFIDPKGALKFVAGKRYAPAPGEYRYDMPDGEFTHEDDNCSFETLLARSGLRDAALRRIGEIVHDIDLKDGKFGHPETAGIAHVIAGLCRAQGDDETRVARGAELFDTVYAQFQRDGRKGWGK
jgi:hypothetical protein